MMDDESHMCKEHTHESSSRTLRRISSKLAAKRHDVVHMASGLHCKPPTPCEPSDSGSRFRERLTEIRLPVVWLIAYDSVRQQPMPRRLTAAFFLAGRST